MAHEPGPDATEWAAEPDISARSVLVTIFGDTLLPATTSVWLSQLFKLTDRFGFSGRLIRTSMFRLAAEGWLTNERVGRQSRYHLTPLAIEESEQASHRIYSMGHSSWTGSWTLAVLAGDMADDDTWQNLTAHLGWHGFITLSPGLLASPNTTVDRVRDLCEVIEPKLRVPLATARFADLDQLVDDGFFAAAFDVEGLETSYRIFGDRYSAVLSRPDALTFDDPLSAFTLRTMMVHDLRRIRLRTVDVPPELLPSPWIGDDIVTQAADAYRHLSAAAAPALSEILETDYPSEMPDRFGQRGG
jgi:phenylacetic acid degradation operon negative regulatory protein